MSERPLCPQLHLWRQIYSTLEEAHQQRNDAAIPPPPMTYNMQGWMLSTDAGKELRWTSTVDWAAQYGFAGLIPEISDAEQYYGYGSDD